MAINDQNRSRKTYSFFRAPSIPSSTTLTAGTGIVITNGGGSIVISVDQTQVQVGGTSNVTGSCTIASGTLSVNTAVNLTTEGNVDWFAPTNNTVQSYRGTVVGHSKIVGGALQTGFDWVTQGITPTSSTSSYILSASATDDIGNGLTGYTTGDPLCSTTTATLTGFGYRLSAPADQTSRTLRIYGALSASVAQLTARVSDGSFADVSASWDAVSPGTALLKWTVTYNSANEGQRLHVQVLTTTNHLTGSSASTFIKFTCATLSSSV